MAHFTEIRPNKLSNPRKRAIKKKRRIYKIYRVTPHRQHGSRWRWTFKKDTQSNLLWCFKNTTRLSNNPLRENPGDLTKNPENLAHKTSFEWVRVRDQRHHSDDPDRDDRREGGGSGCEEDGGGI